MEQQKTSKKQIIVLLSGNGSTFQAIHDKCKNVEIVAVFSNNHAAYGMQRAIDVGIRPVISYDSTSDLENHIKHYTSGYDVSLIILAGYMRILSPDIIQFCSSKNIDIINIHPSLLPKHKGLHTHKRALEAKDSQHGITIHYVNEKMDDGPIIAQIAFDIELDDTEETLTNKVKELEQHYYPLVLDSLVTATDLHEELY